MTASGKDQGRSVAVLASGGVESAALLAEAVRRYERVYPVYVRKGLSWETVEMSHLKKLLKNLESDGLAPLTVLSLPLGPVYKREHWGLGKSRVPGFRAPDADVYLPGRNLLLLSLAGLFCSLRRIPMLWLGILKGNPFQDARAGFLRQMEQVIGESLGSWVRIAAPLKDSTKGQVIRRWSHLPWQDTFSCLNPVNHRHCGRCQKCGERQTGFRMAGLPDPTRYARP